MAYNYLIPSIASLPVGYDCTFVVAEGLIAARLTRGTGRVLRRTAAIVEGATVATTEVALGFRDGTLVEGENAPIRWPGAGTHRQEQPGYLEIAYDSADGSPCFATNRPIAPYAIYAAPGRKSFFSDNSQKFSNPVVIAQIAEFGEYVDGYPVVEIDRARDYGESLVLINPYKKPVLATIRSHDARSLPRIRVPAMSARRVDLSGLLDEAEERWSGRIQMTANNRLIVYDMKHSLADPTAITDHEHMDPYRSDPTHFPLTRHLRLRAGEWASRARAAVERLRRPERFAR